MADELQQIPSFADFIAQETGRDVNPIANVGTTEKRVPSFDEFIASKGFGPHPFQITPSQSVEEQERSEFGKGLSRGILHTQALLHGAAGAIGDVFGADDFAQRRMDDYMRLTQDRDWETQSALVPLHFVKE